MSKPRCHRFCIPKDFPSDHSFYGSLAQEKRGFLLREVKIFFTRLTKTMAKS